MTKSITSICLLLALNLPAQTIHELNSNSNVQEFIVDGPYHQEGLDPDNWPDLLEVEFIEEESAFGMNGEGRVVQAENNRIDFNRALGDSALALAYAHFEVSTPVAAPNALLVISSEDGAKVFLNGEVVHTYFGGGSWHLEHKEVSLRAGTNHFVIKVPNRDYGWSLSVSILDDEGAANYFENKDNSTDEFLSYHNELVPRPRGDFGYTFYPGRFPELIFEQPVLAREKLGGSYSIKTRWFNRELKEVLYPREPGRYAYYSEITGANGQLLKRAATLFCAPDDWDGWTEKLYADLSYYPINGATRDTWTTHQEAISQTAGFIVFESIMGQKRGAILQAFVDEMQRSGLEPGKLNTPVIWDGDYHARLKRRILGVENVYPELNLPKKVSGSAPALTNLDEKEKKKYQKMNSELKAVGAAWMEDDGTPFDMVIARGGKILFHESFGENLYGEFTIETPSEIASITKLMTGILFAQFVDQGIIGIDDPVGKYLPDVPLEGPNALTLRHCFTHTGGIDFFAHGIYGGVFNQWLEGTILETLKGDTVGNQLLYNGMGYDLAGKVMELVTGKSIFRLMQEYIYDPLEMTNTVHDWDLGFSIHSTAYDLAKVAQLILNKGTYGDLQFFSEETYDKIVPTDLNPFYPRLDQKWGIGMTVMDWNITDEKSGEQRPLVSDGIIGHGSATSSMFWVIPKQNMIITQSRRRGNRNFAPNYIKMMEVVEKYLVE